jgi:hypothetical protein
LPFTLNIDPSLLSDPEFAKINLIVKNKELIVDGILGLDGILFNADTTALDFIKDNSDEFPVKWKIKETLKGGKVVYWVFEGRRLSLEEGEGKRLSK